MKLKLLFSPFVFCLVFGCGSRSTSEKAIADFVQTDKQGVWTDLQFEVIEMGEPVMITVGDSIRILKETFEKKREEELDFANTHVERYSNSLQKEGFSAMREFYQNRVDKYQKMADSLSRLKPVLPASYADTDPQKVLAQEVTCKYSIMAPFIKARQEITETFVLNADGSKCYRYKLGRSRR